MERAIRVVEQLKGPIVPINTCFGDDDSLNVRCDAEICQLVV